MKKGFFKLIAMLTVAIVLCSNVMVSADSYNWFGDMLYKNREIKEYVRTGDITGIKNNMITLGEGSAKMMFKLTDKSVITDFNNKKLETSDLIVGMSVEIIYNKVSADKKDKVNEVVSIKATKNTTINYATIDSIVTNTKKEKTATIIYETMDSNGRTVENIMDIIIDSETKIYNVSGKLIKSSDLKEEMLIKVEYSDKITKSNSPQAYAYTIEVLEAKEERLIIENAVIEEINLNEKNVRVNYSLKVGVNTYNYTLVLMVDSDTSIIGINGKATTLEKLKAGMKINVEHKYLNSLTTKSYASKIRVIRDAEKPVYTDGCELYNLLFRLLSEIDYEDWINCIKNHKHDWSQIRRSCFYDFDGWDDLDDYYEDYFENYFKNMLWYRN